MQTSGQTADLLRLVRIALDEFEDRPLASSARRAARIASKLGDTVVAVRLGLELKPTGGHPPSNADDTRRMMADDSAWGESDSPVEQAMAEYLGGRSRPDGYVLAFGLGELEMHREISDDLRQDISDANYADWLDNRSQLRNIEDRLRHYVFTLLCSWERTLTFSNTNERIFSRFQTAVDRLLAGSSPQLLDTFNAVYRRLHDASTDPDASVTEELSQAVTSCRRILKAVADHVYPGSPGNKSSAGHSLNDSAYRNRLTEYLKSAIESSSEREVLNAAISGIDDRYRALDQLANKGVHATIAVDQAELCAINTYIICGEVLRLSTAPPSEAATEAGTI